MGLAPEGQRASVLTCKQILLPTAPPIWQSSFPKPEHQEPQGRVRNCTRHLEQIVSGLAREALLFHLLQFLVKLNFFMALEQKLLIQPYPFCLGHRRCYLPTQSVSSLWHSSAKLHCIINLKLLRMRNFFKIDIGKKLTLTVLKTASVL